MHTENANVRRKNIDKSMLHLLFYLNSSLQMLNFECEICKANNIIKPKTLLHQRRVSMLNNYIHKLYLEYVRGLVIGGIQDWGG